MRRRLGTPCVHRDPRSARSRRDGFDGVEPSGHDNWLLLVQAVSDTPDNDQRISNVECCWRPPQRLVVDCQAVTQVQLYIETLLMMTMGRVLKT